MKNPHIEKCVHVLIESIESEIKARAQYIFSQSQAWRNSSVADELEKKTHQLSEFLDYIKQTDLAECGVSDALKNDATAEKDLDQQLVGWYGARTNQSIQRLVDAMKIKKDVWERYKESGGAGWLPGQYVEAIDDFFESKPEKENGS